MRAALVPALFIAIIAACSTFTSDDTSVSPNADGGGDGEAPDGIAPTDGSPAEAAPCEAGKCVPTFMAQSSVQIQMLVVDATSVIWLEWPVAGGPGDLRSCPKSGCDATSGPHLIARLASPGYLVSNGVTAFVTEASGAAVGVWRIEGGLTRTRLDATTTTSRLYHAVARPDALYVIQYSSDGSFSRDVFQLALPNADNLTPIATYAGGPNTTAATASATRLYLGAQNMPAIVSCPLTPTNSFSDYRVTSDGYGYSLATDDSRVFWINEDNLLSCADGATCNSPMTELTTGGGFAGRPHTVIYDNGSLFVETSGGDLVECKAASCAGSARIIAHEAQFEDGLDGVAMQGASMAVASDAIFYVARDGPDAGPNTYRVMRVQRSPL